MTTATVHPLVTEKQIQALGYTSTEMLSMIHSKGALFPNNSFKKTAYINSKHCCHITQLHDQSCKMITFVVKPPLLISHAPQSVPDTLIL